MARNVGSLLLIGAAVLVCIGTQAFAQGRRYSLAPIALFPCGAVNIQGNSITFHETIVFVCNGKEQLGDAGRQHHGHQCYLRRDNADTSPRLWAEKQLI